METEFSNGFGGPTRCVVGLRPIQFREPFLHRFCTTFCSFDPRFPLFPRLFNQNCTTGAILAVRSSESGVPFPDHQHQPKPKYDCYTKSKHQYLTNEHPGCVRSGTATATHQPIN